ncbi:HAD family hydrolase [Lewinella sp. IMCC34191]|uniref:HAD family hydrolase n=1 Tax=Lewinella sp. IMCC34191 TaxID=2259172 RepID=UPI000E2550B7|nr:HAD family phosphatase [Lewinella sp. IMCC34191]
MLKGLLCDLDGTLANSEPLHCTAWLSLLAEEYDLDYDEHWFDQWIGTSDRLVANYLVTEHDLATSDEELIAQKQTRFQDAVRREGSTFTGVPEQLAIIAKEFPLAIATNSGRSDADLMIAATRLDQFTQISVTATDVEHMKPEPDIYLLAAKKLGLPASECIAIEDSGAGGAAAKAAGCYLIGLTDKVTQADEHVEDNAAALERALELLRAG